MGPARDLEKVHLPSRSRGLPMGEQRERRSRKNSASRLGHPRRELREPCRNQGVEIHPLSWNFPREGLASTPFRQKEDSMNCEVPAGNRDILQSMVAGGCGPPFLLHAPRTNPGAVSLPNVSMQGYAIFLLSRTQADTHPQDNSAHSLEDKAGHSTWEPVCSSVTPETSTKATARQHSTQLGSLWPSKDPRKEEPHCPRGDLPCLPPHPLMDCPGTPSLRYEPLPQVCFWKLCEGEDLRLSCSLLNPHCT